MRVPKWFDTINLKRCFNRKRPLYTRLFVANLGSVGLDRGFHTFYALTKRHGQRVWRLGIPRKATSLDLESNLGE